MKICEYGMECILKPNDTDDLNIYYTHFKEREDCIEFYFETVVTAKIKGIAMRNFIKAYISSASAEA